MRFTAEQARGQAGSHTQQPRGLPGNAVGALWDKQNSSVSRTLQTLNALSRGEVQALSIRRNHNGDSQLWQNISPQEHEEANPILTCGAFFVASQERWTHVLQVLYVVPGFCIRVSSIVHVAR